MEKNLRPYLAELIGTMAFVFLSAGAVCADQLAAFVWHRHPGLVVKVADAEEQKQLAQAVNPVVIEQSRLGRTGIALVTGLVYAVALAITLPISGGFLNPVVPLTLWVFKRQEGSRTSWLVGSQLLGAFLGGLFVWIAFSVREDVQVAASLGTPHLDLAALGVERVNMTALLWGILVELVLTFLLVFAIFGLVLDPRARRAPDGWARQLPALWLGLLVAAGVAVAFGLTGGAMNPARWFGPAVWEWVVVPLRTQGPMRDHPVYWIGPILGGLLAGVVYTSFVWPGDRTEPVPVEPNAAGSKPGNVSSTLYRSRKAL